MYKIDDCACIKSGTYIGELVNATEIETRYGKSLRLIFQIGDPYYSLVSGICNVTKININSKTYRWFSALNGKDIEPGTEISPQDFLGCVVEIVVEEARKDGRSYYNVVDLVRLTTNANAQVAPFVKENYSSEQRTKL